ncbi:MAG: MNIO family bufferin maturase [Gemmatimonadota bacterium]
MNVPVVATVDGKRHAPLQAGVGLRLPHLLEVAATRPAVAWFEVHPENFLGVPHAAEVLGDLSRDYPISVHTVGVSVGSARGVDAAHLARVAALVRDLDPIFVSGHLAWSTHEGEYLNDLLPLPYDEESLDVVARHVDEVQAALGRPFVLENPSSYVGFAGSTMREPEFLNRIAERTGCLLLCDVSNVFLSASNLGYDADEYLRAVDARHVAELHLGGFNAEPDESTPGATVLVDTHGTTISDDAWSLYKNALRLFGPRPTLIEWDNDIPALDALLVELAKADALLEASLTAGAHGAR